MVSGIAAKNENGTNTVNITVTMVTGKTVTTIVTTTKTAIKISRTLLKHNPLGHRTLPLGFSVLRFSFGYMVATLRRSSFISGGTLQLN
jgi:hypothetical protein